VDGEARYNVYRLAGAHGFAAHAGFAITRIKRLALSGFLIVANDIHKANPYTSFASNAFFLIDYKVFDSFFKHLL